MVLSDLFRLGSREGQRADSAVGRPVPHRRKQVVNRGEQELLAYQWNPGGAGWVTRPHLHVGPGAGELVDDFHRVHLPTGRIALEGVLRLLIEELAVQPLREDWSDVLDATQAGYEQWRSWSVSSGRR